MSKYYVLQLIFCNICACVKYSVPPAHITALKPSGFVISVPDDDGIQFVAFNIKINKNILRNQPGDYVNHVSHPANERWSYIDDKVCLQTGDRLNYWIFVQKNSEGYNSEVRRFKVKEFSSKDDITSTQRPVTPSPTVASTTPATTFEKTNDCNAFVQNVTQSIFHLENQMNVLREENNILRELASGDNLRLNLTGLITLTGEPLEIVKFVLDEKLDVEGRVVKNAWRNGNATVTFEVDSLNDKVEIIRRAKDKLMQSSQIKIYV